jgi:hypothetical protein
MKKICLIASVFLAALLLTSCSVTRPVRDPQIGPSIPINTLKIKKMYPVSYEYNSEDGCSEVELLRKFAGQTVRLSDGNYIFIEDILNIHAGVFSKEEGFQERFRCLFWGIAVEYEK